jgi:hypothetical protein
MQDETNMSNFLFIVKDLLIQIARVRDVIKYEDVVLITLNDLLESYESFVQVMFVQKTFQNFD